ncbi:hypothetical protein QJS10_CPA08g00691 [Acorus calamus]|uniref:Coenzyme Q-binding protein COQ10 START domain-containing protein n=1 Tax=Acorus calamus TaxID=4465 RepID=A0AAV9E8P3_ACOCL|nr:hypothetical protein QJS10_CPA08g00691 [Acorus calamus]
MRGGYGWSRGGYRGHCIGISKARVVLDLQEFPYLANGCELRFSMVDGDFKKYEGKWSVKAGSRSSTTILSYEVNVIPQFNFPAIFIERIISSDLPVNLRAIACRAEGNYEETQKASTIGSVSEIDSYASPIHSTLPVSPYNGVNSRWGIIGKTCRLDRPCMVDEVHLRRFDGLLENGGARRCVIASITVKAPLREVWKVLTAYEALPEFVPNLAISKILLRANNKVRILQEGCKGLLYMVLHARVVLDLHEKLEQEIRFEQVEGDFESFRGRWVFEQLGNHHTLLKYVVESRIRKDTFLSEAILEEVIYEDLPSNLCAIRDFVEERESLYSKQSVGDDSQPINTETGVEKRSPAQEASGLHAPNPSRQRPKVPGLQRDIEVLKTELLTFISKYGQEGFMPMRKQLRLHGRVDIEKAITRMGGFRKIATLMNLSLAYKHRKPKGYWDNLENLQVEIERFQRSWGMDPTYMPSRKSFERAEFIEELDQYKYDNKLLKIQGHYDIARALEKWGGLHEVARLLSLELRHPTRQANPSREHKNENLASLSSGESSLQEQDKTHNKPIVSQDAQKWLMKLKDLDINWVE